MIKIIKYIGLDILRNKIVLAYTLFLLCISLSVFSLEDNSQKGLLTILNLVLFLVPLMSVIFSTIYTYNSSEFIELLVSQPISRRRIWVGLWISLAGALSLSFLAGVGIPLLIFNASSISYLLTIMGMMMTMVFVSLAMLGAVKMRDKARGIGVAILTWIYFSVAFDGLLLFLLFQFAEYPIEKGMIGLSMLNPVDLTRIVILMKMDDSALMGFTGALLRSYFGTEAGIVISVLVMSLWIVLPLFVSTRFFKRKDL